MDVVVVVFSAPRGTRSGEVERREEGRGSNCSRAARALPWCAGRGRQQRWRGAIEVGAQVGGKIRLESVAHNQVPLSCVLLLSVALREQIRQHGLGAQFVHADRAVKTRLPYAVVSESNMSEACVARVLERFP